MYDMILPPGTLLMEGRYEIEEVIGKGGFGITYRGVQTGLKRKVAIKEFFMKEFCFRDEDSSHVSTVVTDASDTVAKFREKFIKEASLIASFSNEHIIGIFDVFEENGTAYYVMEYLDGGNLMEIVKGNGAMNEREAVRYIRQVADALSEVHSCKLLHLDVKPANIMLDKRGRAVLIDFGISKHYDETGSQTSNGIMAFSDGYAPMEQYKRGGVSSFTPATDIYSLGATLYYLLTATAPPHASEVLENGLKLPSGMSPSVSNAIVAAMSPSRVKRPQNIAEFLALLDNEYSGKSSASFTGTAAAGLASAMSGSVPPAFAGTPGSVPPRFMGGTPGQVPPPFMGNGMNGAATLGVQSVPEYRIGQYYDDGYRKGIVFELSEGGRHGKIVNLNGSMCCWAARGAANSITGSRSSIDGEWNMVCMKRYPGWQNKYPAFAFCDSLGRGWYLPSSEELKQLHANIDAVNRGLASVNAEQLQGILWSSTEYKNPAYGNRAWYIYINNGKLNTNDKSYSYSVRAVSRF